MLCTTLSYIMSIALVIFLMSVKGTDSANKYGEAKILKEPVIPQ